MADQRAGRQNFAGVKITLDGADLNEPIEPRLMSLTLSEKRGGEADQLDIVIHDQDKRRPMAIPKEGAKIRLSIGWLRGKDVPIGMVDKGSFKVDEVEWGGPPDTITIRARSADLTDSFRVRREKKHKDTTLGKIIEEIAADNGLKARVAPALASIEVPVMAQDQRSDMALVKALGRRHDAVATVKDGTLIFAPIGAGITASGKPLPSFALSKRESDNYRYSRAKREDYAGVEARYHDQGKAKRETVLVGSPETPGRSTTSTRKPKRLKRTFHRKEDARHAAEAEDKRIRRAEAEFEYDCSLGDPRLSPEQKGKVTGFKPEIDGRQWLIAEVTHSLDGNGGLRSKLKLETAI